MTTPMTASELDEIRRWAEQRTNPDDGATTVAETYLRLLATIESLTVERDAYIAKAAKAEESRQIILDARNEVGRENHRLCAQIAALSPAPAQPAKLELTATEAEKLATIIDDETPAGPALRALFAEKSEGKDSDEDRNADILALAAQMASDMESDAEKRAIEHEKEKWTAEAERDTALARIEALEEIAEAARAVAGACIEEHNFLHDDNDNEDDEYDTMMRPLWGRLRKALVAASDL